MENSNNISLKNRRIIVVLLGITFMFICLPFFIIEKEESSVLKYVISGASVITFLIIAYYLRLKTDAFLIATYGEDELDERQKWIKLKAQRDAYNIIFFLIILILLEGGKFFKNDINTFITLLSALMIILKIYLPTMIIAWREKEV